MRPTHPQLPSPHGLRLTDSRPRGEVRSRAHRLVQRLPPHGGRRPRHVKPSHLGAVTAVFLSHQRPSIATVPRAPSAVRFRAEDGSGG